MKNKSKMIAAATISSVLLTGCGTNQPIFPHEDDADSIVTVDPIVFDDNDEDILYPLMGIMEAPQIEPNME